MDFKDLLKEVDMSSAQVARKIGVTRPTVYSWVRGETSPTVANLVDIAKAMNVPVERVMECFVKKGA